MTEKDRLVEELRDIADKPLRQSLIEEVADFILSDRKRIVDPLVNLLKEIKDAHNNTEFDYEMNELMREIFHKKIDETLRNAGVTL